MQVASSYGCRFSNYKKNVKMLGPSSTYDFESVFWVCALSATVFFFIRIALMVFLGLGHHDTDVDVYHDTTTPEGSESSFTILSINSVTAFLMMFGWSGLACLKGHEFSLPISLLIAFIVATFCMFFTAYLFRLAMKLTSSGDLFSMEELIDQIGSVYLQIPEEGMGKIQIPARGITRELQAISEDKKEIGAFKSVKIVRIVDSNTVSVRET